MSDLPDGRIRAVRPGESSDEEVNMILEGAENGWWEDSRMWGIFAHVPEALKAWVNLILGTGAEVDPVSWELMALRGAFITKCHY